MKGRIRILFCGILLFEACESIVPPPEIVLPRDETESIPIKIDDLLMLDGCTLAPGMIFPIAGKGFKNEDVIIMSSATNTLECEKSLREEEGVDVFLPEGAESGLWSFAVIREREAFTLGTVSLQIAPDARPLIRPKVIAHRGAHSSAPENSIEALRRAQEMGCDGSEADVWLSLDGVLFCHHDEKIKGYGITSTFSQTLRQQHLSNGESLPTLEAYLLQASKMRSCRLVIEIKDHKDDDQNERAVQETVRLVRSLKMQDQVDYISSSYEVCRKVASLVGSDQTMVGYITYDHMNFDSLHSFGILNVDYSFDYFKRQHDWYIPALWEAGLTVNVWALSTEQDIQDALRWSLDYITVDNPEYAVSVRDRLF